MPYDPYQYPFKRPPEPDPEPAADRPLTEEEEEVIAWRHGQLMDAGYGLASAFALAGDRNVDLHEACEMLKSGCPEQTALKILT